MSATPLSTDGALPGTSLKDEWNFTAGFDLAVSPRLRDPRRSRPLDPRSGTAEGSRQSSSSSRPAPAAHGRGRRWGWGWWWWRIRYATPAAGQDTGREFRLEPGNLNLSIGNIGVRLNPFGHCWCRRIALSADGCGSARSRDAGHQCRLCVLMERINYSIRISTVLGQHFSAVPPERPLRDRSDVPLEGARSRSRDSRRSMIQAEPLRRR